MSTAEIRPARAIRGTELFSVGFRRCLSSRRLYHIKLVAGIVTLRRAAPVHLSLSNCRCSPPGAATIRKIHRTTIATISNGSYLTEKAAACVSSGGFWVYWSATHKQLPETELKRSKTRQHPRGRISRKVLDLSPRPGDLVDLPGRGSESLREAFLGSPSHDFDCSENGSDAIFVRNLNPRGCHRLTEACFPLKTLPEAGFRPKLHTAPAFRTDGCPEPLFQRLIWR